jgi:hypothetical protein
MRTLTLLAAALWLGAVSGCEKKTEETGPGAKATKVSESVEYKLAVHNARSIVAENDPAIAQFKTVLSSLDAKYPEEAKAIGDMSIEGQKVLESAGVKESLLAVMQNVEKAGGTHPDYATAIKAYVAKRKPPGR